MVTPVVGWIVYEWSIVSKIKPTPLPFPANTSPNLVYAQNDLVFLDSSSLKAKSLPPELELDRFSDNLIDALIASEDSRFYDHNGFDFVGLLRAIKQTIQGNPQGGSTISQQLAKKLFIEPRFEAEELEQTQKKVTSASAFDVEPFLEKMKPYRRKLQQILMAFRLEKNYSKEEILRAYLNRVYLGNRYYSEQEQAGVIHGFEEASQFYFDKPAKDLTVSQSATLVAMLPEPNVYNPIKTSQRQKNETDLYDLRDLRIDRMLKLEKISETEASKAKQEKIPQIKRKPETANLVAPHFLAMVEEELETILTEIELLEKETEEKSTIKKQQTNVTSTEISRKETQNKLTIKKGQTSSTNTKISRKGTQNKLTIKKGQTTLKETQTEVEEKEEVQIIGSGQYIIETSLDLNAQKEAEKAIQENVKTQGIKLNYNQGALVTLDRRTGAIIALVGGANPNFADNQFDNATRGDISPASTFKLFPFLTALEQGIPLNKIYACTAVEWMGEKIEPCRGGTGSISIVQSIIMSENAPVFRMSREVGLENIVKLSQKFDIQFDESYQNAPALVWGEKVSHDNSTLLKMTNAYATVANNGIKNTPHTIVRIRDRNECDIPQQISTCKILYSRKDDLDSTQVISPETAKTAMKTLRQVVTNGTATNANISPAVAGKTGTSTDNNDLLFIGIEGQKNIVTGIWLGKDCTSEEKQATNVCQQNGTEGSSGTAVELWSAYMDKIIK